MYIKFFILYTNIFTGELLVIVEYCRYGNLHNYLIRHRGNFIDQIDPNSGQIDSNIGNDVINRAYSVSSNKSRYIIVLSLLILICI